MAAVWTIWSVLTPLQSTVSTSQMISVRPNCASIARTVALVAPYGGRSSRSVLPVNCRSTCRVWAIFEVISAVLSAVRSGWVYVWLPIHMPAAFSAHTSEGLAAALAPMLNVSRDDVEEMALPGFGLPLTDKLGDCSYRVEVHGIEAVVVWRNASGKVVKAPPAGRPEHRRGRRPGRVRHHGDRSTADHPGRRYAGTAGAGPAGRTERGGDLHTYRIHCGSGNILIAPENRYLYIIPDSARPAKESKLFLPFEGDSRLSEIISKALLLAADKIKDPVILRQM